MAITPTIVEQWRAGNMVEAVGTLAFTGNYTTNGVAVDFAAAGLRGGGIPVLVMVPAFKGHSFQYVAGTKASDGKLVIHLTSTGAELSAAAFPAALTGGGAIFECVFKFGL